MPLATPKPRGGLTLTEWEKPKPSISPRGKFGAYLNLDGSEPLPPGFLSLLEDAVILGREFGDHRSKSQPPRLWAAYNQVKQKIRAQTILLSPYNPWASVYLAVVWHAATLQAKESQKDTFGTWPLFGAQCQRALTRAFLGIAPEDSQTVFSLHQEWHGSELEWVQDCTGAMSVARTAKALAKLGAPPILPRLYVDTKCKIDLLAELTDQTGKYLCLQVKTDRRRRLPHAQRIVIRQAQADSYEIATIRRGIVKFMIEEGFPNLLAGVISVGLGESPPWDVEPSTHLCEALAALLAE